MRVVGPPAHPTAPVPDGPIAFGGRMGAGLTNGGNLHRHEVWHTRQWAIFGGGAIFPTLYGIETWRTDGDECENVFEIWAGLEDGGYK